MERIYNYCCLYTPECSLIGKTQKVHKDSSQEKEPEYCPECESEMKLLGTEMDGGFLRFSSLDDKGKKEVLKKRARKHYEKFEKKDVENKKLLTQNDIRKQVGAKPLKRL